MIGYLSFNAAFANFDEAAAQGQKVGATIVVVYFVHTRRIRYDIPDAVQNPIRTAGAHRIDDAYESGDYVTCGDLLREGPIFWARRVMSRISSVRS
jgi:hypothetical protein